MTQSSLTSTSTTRPAHDGPAAHLRQTYEGWQALFAAQSNLVQRFFETQARQVADVLSQADRGQQLRFRLPDQVALAVGGPAQPVPAEFREQLAGGLVERLTRVELSQAVRQRLAELEQSPNRALAVSAGLLRHTVAVHMVQNMLPSGRTVTYAAAPGEEIPSLPANLSPEPGSALTEASDAIAEEGAAEAGRGELLVPYVPAARRFYMPQWVAFGDDDRLLTKSSEEAQAHITSMQRFLGLLHLAVSLAPYIVADDAYQQKRYGMLGQLVNQGRALARFQTSEIVQTIQRRAAAQDLNRGLSLSLPYFDDQALQLKTHPFEIIPAGRIMFVPAFVVRAVREEAAKVAQDTRLSPSTRHHLLAELKTLEDAFDAPAA